MSYEAVLAIAVAEGAMLLLLLGLRWLAIRDLKRSKGRKGDGG